MTGNPSILSRFWYHILIRTTKKYLNLAALILLLSAAINGAAQESKIDSLMLILESVEEDTSRVNTLNALASIIYQTDPEQAIKYGTEAKNLAEQINFPAGEALACKNIGLGYYMQGENEVALSNWKFSLQIYRELGDDNMVANLLSNMGAVYYLTGQSLEAIDYYQSALKLAEARSDSSRLSTLYLNMGVLYSEIPATFDTARNYYLRAIEIGEALGDTDIMGIGNINLGEIFIEMEEYDSALYYFENSLSLANSPVAIASSLNFMGSIYSEKGDYQAAINYHQEALELARNENAQHEIAGILLALGSTYERMENHTKAIEYYQQAESLAELLSLNFELSMAYEGLATNFAILQDYPDAYKYLALQNTIDNTIYKIESEKRDNEVMFIHQKEKKEYEITLLEHQSEIEQMLVGKRKAIVIAIPSVIVFLLFTFMLFLRIRYIRKVNVTINDQKDEIEAQRDEIEAQRDEVESQRDQLKDQHDLLSEQKTEIIDSITYAKKIQSALMPPEQYFQEILNEVFILFKPRDIVSGDFYWIKQVNQYVVLAAADCTGHGIPGAFMSLLGMSYLNEIVHGREITQANQILNELRKQIRNSLRQHGEPDESMDGIDMALCVIDEKGKTVQYAGANNPLYLIRNKNITPELTEIKADRMPLGYYQGKFKSFTNNDIQLEYGDVIYMFSDGYVDQKGGKEGKKFMSKKFKDLLLEIHEEPMQEQKRILDKSINDWMGTNSQIDDMLVIGVRI